MNMSQHPSPNEHIKRRREYAGPAFLSGAFRPFFLAASVWAIVSISLWLFMLNDTAAPSGLTGVNWHIHEMVFGFCSAAMAGFILTAIPNWTGRLPVRGTPLALLALLWLLGRIGILATSLFGMPWASSLDLIFPFVLFLVVLREIVSGKNKRNFPIAVMFGVFACANALYHLEGYLEGLEGYMTGLNGHGWRLGLAMIVMILSLIGGRIVPSFTRNWIVKNGAANKIDTNKLPVPPMSTLDKGVLIVCALALLFWVLAPTFIGSGILLILAGLGQVIRVSRWRGFETTSESIIFVLHIGYAWIGLSMILLGCSLLMDGFITSTAIHGLTIGAIGTMIPAVMSRASLGHSGLAIKANMSLSLAYILISIAALVRIFAGLFMDYYMVLVNLSGALWIAAFVLFAIKFAPLYFKPRPSR